MPQTGLGWAIGALATVVLAGSWTAMLGAARRSLFFEPTSEALARAAEGRRSGEAAALVVVASAVLLAVSARRPWLILLAIPGLVTGAALALAPDSAAFILGLVATAITVPVVLIIAVAVRARPAQRGGQASG